VKSDHSEEQARIYQTQAELYDELIGAEDADGALQLELARHAKLDGADILDVGAGTGRISRLLADKARSLTLVDRAGPMLAVATRHLRRLGTPFSVHEADAQNLPLADAGFDLAVAGWVFGHFRHWMPDGWRAEVSRAVAEMRRVVRPGGTLLVIETLGTGHEQPRKHAGLDEYFDELAALGFTKHWIRTDYEFASVAEAVRICGAFFGPELIATIEQRRWVRVPECTAVFVSQQPAAAFGP
jgi:ubiquinone/menaquinone biosynthesis C-methylase UbiE